jgi:hypothetical protein
MPGWRPSRLGRDPGPAAGLVKPAGPALRGDKNPTAKKKKKKKKKAVTAIAHPAQDRLSNPQERDALGTPCQEPGADFCTRRESPEHE